MESVISKIGLNPVVFQIDMTRCLKINAQMLTVGNLMTFQALINALTLIITLNSVLEDHQAEILQLNPLQIQFQLQNQLLLDSKVVLQDTKLLIRD